MPRTGAAGASAVAGLRPAVGGLDSGARPTARELPDPGAPGHGYLPAPMRGLWVLAKGLEGLGLVVVLVGLVTSIQLGMRDEGLQSMKYESYALVGGGAVFLVGWLLERRIGTR